jgi:hypothetical protein
MLSELAEIFDVLLRNVDDEPLSLHVGTETLQLMKRCFTSKRCFSWVASKEA